MPRLSSKDKYIKEIFDLYKVKGLLLNMEQIAQELNITKKTLYNNFESKEVMIATVVAYFFNELEAKIIDASEKSDNAIESLFSMSSIIRDEIDKLGALLLDNIATEAYDFFEHSNRSSFYSRVIRENLKRGISEGVFRSDIDIEYTTLFYTSAVELFYKKGNNPKFIKNSSVFHSELVKHHLYSIVNIKNRDLLESYL